MKKIVLFLTALTCALATSAQTMNIRQGNVTYAIPAAQAGEMTYTDGTTLTVGSRSYNIADITMIELNDDPVADNTVSVSYDGASAEVVIAGNIAPYIEAKVNGAHVSLLAAETLAEEVTYTLSGESSAGSFYMDGPYKSTFVLSGLGLMNPDSAAVNIQCGKRIKIELAEGTENNLVDGLRGTDDGSDGHKAAFYINGHSEWTGAGSLTVTGNVKHAISADEYVEFGKKTGTILVYSTVGDGLHVNEYFEMKGGVVSIHSTGDGIDVGLKSSSTDAQNGQLIVKGGTLTVITTGDAARAMKCEGDMLISGGAIQAQTTGSAIYEASENDLSSCAAAKPDGAFTMTDGTVSFTSTGAGGKGINATGAVTVSGGELTVCTTGATFEYNSELDSKPQGIKSDVNIVLEGGKVLSCASADGGNAFKTDAYVLMNGATVMGIAGKKTTPSSTSTCKFANYKDVNVSGGQTVSYDGVSFTVPDTYSNDSAKIVVSSPTM